MVLRNRSFLLVVICAGCALLFLLGRSLLNAPGTTVFEEGPSGSDPLEVSSSDSSPETALEQAPAKQPARSVEAEEAGRVALPRSALSGEIRDPSGEPVEGARLSWTVILEDQCSKDLRWSDLDHERIRAATLSTTTGARGSFTFEDPPEGIEGSRSVVWISHAKWRAQSVILPVERDGWVWPIDPELVAGEPVEVEVKGGAGDPCPQAVVSQHLVFTGSHPDLTEEEIEARRFYWRELLTDDEGTALAPPGNDKIQLTARKGDRMSEPYVGIPAEPVLLTLLDSFSVSGEVRADAEIPTFSGTRIVLGFRDEPEAKAAWSALSMQVRDDGSFGPITYPISPGDLLATWIGYGDVVGEYGNRPAPRPGEHVQLIFEVQVGERVSVRVEDVDELPIEGATVWGYPLRVDQFVDVGIKAITDAEGRATRRGLPPGQVAIRAGKEGYAYADRGMAPPPAPQIILPWDGDEELLLILPPSVKVAGVVVMDGEPVTDFELSYWTGHENSLRRDFSDEEGRFEIAVEAGSEISLMASVEGLPQSGTGTVTVGEDEALDVELAIPPSRICRGQVIDSVTGGPLTAARLLPWTTSGGELLWRRGDEYTTDSEGRFEIPGFYPGRGGLEITADGYSTEYTTVHANHGEIIEYGIVPLSPLASAVVRVVGLEGDPTRCRLWQNLTKPHTRVPLSADGSARLENLRPGLTTFLLQLPDGTIHTTKQRLLPAKVAEVLIRLGGDAELEVVVEGGTEHGELDELSVRISFSAAGRVPETMEGEIPESGRTVLRGLRAGPSVVELLGSKGQPLQCETIELAPGVRSQVRLSPDGDGRRLRLLAGEGDPCSTTYVRITLPGDRSGWCRWLWTDVEGELELGVIEASSILLFVQPTAGAVAFGVPVELDPDPSKVTEVHLETPAKLTLRLCEEGRQCSGVEMQFSHGALPPGHGGISFHSDELGIVSGLHSTEGEYLVTPESPRYWPLTTAIDVAVGREPYPVELYSLGTVRVCTLSRTGTPAPGVELELRHTALGAGVRDWIRDGSIASRALPLSTGPSGDLELSGLPRGSYEWTAKYPDGTRLRGAAMLPPEGVIEVEIRP